jgi:nidogen (entactin)
MFNFDSLLGLDPYSAQHCASGHMVCHSSSSCEDLRDGFCCKCINGWYGDGRTCLPKGIPQRVTGKVNGMVNSVSIEDQELHCYVVTEDGRTYTAISKYFAHKRIFSHV